MLGWVVEKKKIEEEMVRICNLKTELLRLGGCPEETVEIFAYAIKFFNITSKFQDEGNVKYLGLKETQKLFNSVLATVGRSYSKFGMNRTQKGQKVTLDNLYCGEIYGLEYNTARFWKNCQVPYYIMANKYSDMHKSMLVKPLASTIIARYQLRNLMIVARKKLLDLSNELLKTN